MPPAPWKQALLVAAMAVAPCVCAMHTRRS
uniref:Uncharacterized protein n=1 Tax=Arundo donax TaxID=35708 RepID=A0A0A8XPY6_ARUDO